MHLEPSEAMIYVYLQIEDFPYGFMHHLGNFNLNRFCRVIDIRKVTNIIVTLARHHVMNSGITKMVSLFIPFHCLLGLGISEGQKIFQSGVKIKSQ